MVSGNLPEEEWNLLIAVLDGEVDAQDPVFQNWLQSSTSNVSIYEEMKSLQALAKKEPKVKEFEEQKGILWEQVENRLFNVKRIFPWRRAAAAVLIPLIIGGGLMWKYLASSDSIAENSSFTKSVPAAGAILKLSDGSLISLDSVKELQEKDGTYIIADNANSLNYVKDSSTLEESNFFNTLIIPKGGLYKVTLADGTKVWLNAASELNYPIRFDGNTRTVTLKGEAYFEVAKDPLHPFIVNTSKAVIEVIGTAFNVQSYDNEPSVVTTLIEGIVAVSSYQKETAKVQLKPSQQATYTQPSQPIKVALVETELFTSWREGILIFENERLEVLMRNLDRWYDIDIIYKEPSLKELRFTGKASKTNSIDYILDLVSQTTQVQFKVQGNKIIIDKK